MRFTFLWQEKKQQTENGIFYILFDVLHRYSNDRNFNEIAKVEDEKEIFFFSMQWRRKKCKELVKEKFVGSETCNKRLLCIYTMYKCVW